MNLDKQKLTKKDEDFLDNLKVLPLEDILKNYQFTFEGEPVSAEETTSLLNFMKTIMEIKNAK